MEPSFVHLKGVQADFWGLREPRGGRTAISQRRDEKNMFPECLLPAGHEVLMY